MFFVDLLLALAVGLLLTAIFSLGLRNRGPWDLWWVFLLVVFLAAWAGSVWMTPVGPPLFGVYWLSPLLVGLMIALLLAAATPQRSPRTRAEAIAQARAEEETALAFTIFFWILLIGLVIAVLLAYV
jgi:hypothetical protein